jgi:hypothetical protein
MIEQLDTNQNYFLLKTPGDRLDHLKQLNIQKINRSQSIFSSLKSEKRFIHTEED